MPDLLHHLREATRALHLQLDGGIGEEDPTLTRGAYTRYLERFHAALAMSWPLLDWERLEAMGLPEAARRRARYENLGRDLRGLGVASAALPPVSPGADDAAMIGALYVLEGSIHGGREHLRGIRNHGDFAGEDIRFIRGFGPDSPSMWADFTTWLREADVSPASVAAATGAAATVFKNFISVFELSDHGLPEQP